MKSFSPQDIANYYDQTDYHYQKWWGLSENQALHYGYWEKETRNQGEAMENLNHQVILRTKLKESSRFLDAGCGVGGTSIFLAKHQECSGVGISLSEKQVQKAQQNAKSSGLNEKLDFQVTDYRQTRLPESSFDLVLAMESLVNVTNKEAFLVEAMRVLKPGGELLIFEYVTPRDLSHSDTAILNQWVHKWAMPDLWSKSKLEKAIHAAGFNTISMDDITQNIYPSAKAMYRMGLLGAIPSELYNLTHKTRPFAKVHYLSAIQQYKALKKGLWKYVVYHAKKES